MHRLHIAHAQRRHSALARGLDETKRRATMMLMKKFFTGRTRKLKAPHDFHKDSAAILTDERDLDKVCDRLSRSRPPANTAWLSQSR